MMIKIDDELDYETCLFLRDTLVDMTRDGVEAGKGHMTTKEREKYLKAMGTLGDALFAIQNAIWPTMLQDTKYFTDAQRERMAAEDARIGVVYGKHQDPELAEFESRLPAVCDKDHGNVPSGLINALAEFAAKTGAPVYGLTVPGDEEVILDLINNQPESTKQDRL